MAEQTESHHQVSPVETHQFTILDEKAEHQILIINLPPAGIVYVKGVKLFSSADLKFIPTVRKGWFSGVLREQTKMTVNDSPYLQMIGVKHPTKQGRVLIIDLAIYRESFYYNEEALLASRKTVQNRVRHSLLPMALAEHSQRPQNILDALEINQDVIALQAESSILEKNLGKEQSFWVQRDALIALSKSTSVEVVKDDEVKIKGPGWVFFQTHSFQANRKKAKSNMKAVLALFLLIALLELLLALAI